MLKLSIRFKADMIVYFTTWANIMCRMMIVNEIESNGSYWIACNSIWYLNCLICMWDYNVIALCNAVSNSQLWATWLHASAQNKLQQKYAQAAHINHIPFSKYLRKIESIRKYCCMLFSFYWESANERAHKYKYAYYNSCMARKKSNLII